MKMRCKFLLTLLALSLPLACHKPLDRNAKARVKPAKAGDEKVNAERVSNSPACDSLDAALALITKGEDASGLLVAEFPTAKLEGTSARHLIFMLPKTDKKPATIASVFVAENSCEALLGAEPSTFEDKCEEKAADHETAKTERLTFTYAEGKRSPYETWFGKDVRELYSISGSAEGTANVTLELLPSSSCSSSLTVTRPLTTVEKLRAEKPVEKDLQKKGPHKPKEKKT